MAGTLTKKSRAMRRRKFLAIAGASVVVAGGAGYLLSDRRHVVRSDFPRDVGWKLPLKPQEEAILYLASLAPSGHNTQPWIVKYLAPFHWIIGNDRSKWLPAVDPTQRETILSIGAFLQNLEYAANSFGYRCTFSLLAADNQSEDIVELVLKKTGTQPVFDVDKIRMRRTVRSNYKSEPIKKEHLDDLMAGEADAFQFVPRGAREYQWLNEQTIEANRRQAYRDDAQSELADWMRFSRKDAQTHCDGLTTASMEITGIPGWVLRNFYSKENVLRPTFREQGIDKVRAQVRQSGGWLLLTSKDSSTAALLETGKRFQRMLLRTREKRLAVHPMTQILEEAPHRDALKRTIELSDPVQFILRIGYIDRYPDPVSLRRPVGHFLRGVAR